MERTIEQAFTVPFTYQVRFTENIFDPDNTTLAKLLNNGKKAKAFFVIDQGVVEAHPDLLGQIKSYSEFFKEDFTLCADPLIVPGGEKATREG